ncbi:MAG: serine hydrolase [Pseudomonadota bacterium]
MRTLIATVLVCAMALPAVADDPLLDEAVEFTGQVFFLEHGVPGLVIAAVRGDDSAIFGFGEIAKGSGQAPDGQTRIGVGSITKSFTGLVLARLVAEGTVALTDAVDPYLGVVDQLPTRDRQVVRYLDLATHSGGFRRELAPIDGVEKYSDASFAANLTDAPLLFTPGAGVLYSNVGFDVLGMALAGAAGKPYDTLLAEAVLSPIGLSQTSYAKPEGPNAMAGYDWTGEPMDPGDAIDNRHGASGLYTSADDMVRYLTWSLDRFGSDAEMRTLSHAAYLVRDGLDPVYGMDESGHMDAMALGLVVMMPDGDRPYILQKAGGTNGVFSYIAFAPHRGVGVFMAINQFNFGAGMAMAETANALIATLAPR